MKIVLRFITYLAAFLFFSEVHANECGIGFVRYMNGELPARLTSNPKINMWAIEFDKKLMAQDVQNLKLKSERIDYVKNLAKLVHKDEVFNENLAEVVTLLYRKKLLSYQEIKKIFLQQTFGRTTFSFSHQTKKMISIVNFDPEKKLLVSAILKRSKLSKKMREEYSNILMSSNLKVEDIDIAIRNGMKFRTNNKDFEQFKEYIEFLNSMKPKKIQVGMKNIEKIYNYGYSFSLSPIEGFLQAPHKHFLAQKRRIGKYLTRRIKEIERGLKLQTRNGLIAEIDEAAQREANGIKMRVSEKLRFKKKLDDMELSSTLKRRAREQAKRESVIYRKLLRGCNSGNSKRIASAKTKFTRFKFALMLAGTPTFYILKNKDRMDKDPYFWEKLGHEMMMNVIFTTVSNKLFTNTNTGFWRKYLEGYVKFGALGYIEAASYDSLFGKKSYIRHLQKLYKKDVPDSELEKELEKLKNSPTFEKDIKELIAYLEEMSKKRNTKNFIDKHFSLSTYSSLDNEYKITKEDLESEEAREVLIELLAERLYLQNMGDWGLFQTGGKDTDRFAFYRARATIWDLKGIALNLAIFEMMCREPFGKIGSWAVIVSLIMGDNMLTGDLTYQYRREAINQ